MVYQGFTKPMRINLAKNYQTGAKINKNGRDSGLSLQIWQRQIQYLGKGGSFGSDCL